MKNEQTDRLEAGFYYFETKQQAEIAALRVDIGWHYEIYLNPKQPSHAFNRWCLDVFKLMDGAS